MTILLAIVVLAAGIRLYRIDTAELWLDEACTFRFAEMSQNELVNALFTTEGHPPVYYEFMMLWRSLGGDYGATEAWLRIPSLLAGIALVVATARIATRFVHRNDAFIAALCAALSPLAIYYSIEARHYAVLAALGAFSWLQLERYFQDENRTAGMLSALFVALATGTHFIALFIAPLPLLWFLLWSPRSSELRRRALRAQTLWAIAAMPALVLALLRLSEGNPGTAWLEAQPVHTALYESLLALGGSGPYPSYLGYLGMTDSPQILSYLGLALVVLGLVAGFFHSAHRGARAGAFSWLLLTMVVPALFSLIKPIYLPGRYELAALPILIAVVLFGWTRLLSKQARWLRIAAILCGIMILNLPTLWQFIPQSTDRPWSTLVKQADLPSETTVVCTGLTCPTVRWALTQTSHTVETIGFPSDVEAHPCWRSSAPVPVPKLREEVLALAQAISQRGQTIAIAGEFLVGTTKPASWKYLAPLFQALEAHGYRSTRPEAAGGMWLMRWTRSSAL